MADRLLIKGIEIAGRLDVDYQQLIIKLNDQDPFPQILIHLLLRNNSFYIFFG